MFLILSTQWKYLTVKSTDRQDSIRRRVISFAVFFAFTSVLLLFRDVWCHNALWLSAPVFMLSAGTDVALRRCWQQPGLIGANDRKIERYTAVGTCRRWRKRPSDSGCGETINNRQSDVDVRGALFTRRSYGTCDDMKQYSTVQRTSDISAAAPSHQPTRYGRETERSDAIPIIRSLSVIQFDASDGLIPRYRQKY